MHTLRNFFETRIIAERLELSVISVIFPSVMPNNDVVNFFETRIIAERLELSVISVIFPSVMPNNDVVNCPLARSDTPF